MRWEDKRQSKNIQDRRLRADRQETIWARGSRYAENTHRRRRGQEEWTASSPSWEHEEPTTTRRHQVTTSSKVERAVSGRLSREYFGAPTRTQERMGYSRRKRIFPK